MGNFAPVSAPAVRIVIPSHDRREMVARLVGALVPQIGGAAPGEIVVVCDGCSDGSAEALRAAFGASISIIEQAQAGPGAARNRGAEGATAEFLLFLDDDMTPEDDLVALHLAAQRRIGGGLVLGAIPVDPDSAASFLTEGLAGWSARRDARLREPGVVPGFDDVLTGNLSVGREVFTRLGGFDATFTDGTRFGDEDLEFGWRAVGASVPIAYEPEARAWQRFDKSFADLARDIRRGGASDARFAAKHPGVRGRLKLGRIAELGPWEGRALRWSAAHPAAASGLAMPAIRALEWCRRLGMRGGRLERAHALVRAALYGCGVADAGAAAVIAPTSTS